MSKAEYNLQEYMEQNEYEKEMVVSVSTLEETIDAIHQKMAAKANEAIISMMKYRGVKNISVNEIYNTVTDPVWLQNNMTLVSIRYDGKKHSCVWIIADDDSDQGFKFKNPSDLSAEDIKQIVCLVKELMDDLDEELYSVDKDGDLVAVEQ